jgi:hypothetical protein
MIMDSQHNDTEEWIKQGYVNHIKYKLPASCESLSSHLQLHMFTSHLARFYKSAH